MKRNLMFWMFSVLLGILVFATSCKKDDTNNNNPSGPVGILKIYVHKDLSTGVLMPGAEVRLYKSRHAMTIDSASAIEFTEIVTPFPAVFNNLPYQKYYIKASFESQGDQYMGTDSLFVPVNTTTDRHMKAIKQ